MSQSYSGDVTPRECWDAIANEGDTFLIDVRTMAEWTYVGFPLTPSGGMPLFQEWQSFPSMAVEPAFVPALTAKIEALGGSAQSKLYFLCRSGVRSIAGAAAMTEAGFAACFNVLEGFEGPADAEGHRGLRSGWKAENLPWAQR